MDAKYWGRMPCELVDKIISCLDIDTRRALGSIGKVKIPCGMKDMRHNVPSVTSDGVWGDTMTLTLVMPNNKKYEYTRSMVPFSNKLQECVEVYDQGCFKYIWGRRT